MNAFKYTVIALLILNCTSILAEDALPRRPVATYSIVARDIETGQMGVAVQSHWFSVGPVVPWAEAGIGAVATQSLVDISYGPLGLELMRAGKTAPDALKALLAADAGKEFRQVAMVDTKGNNSVHTGQFAIREAGHQQGDQYSVQANLMENRTVWNAMAQAYETAKGDLAERLLTALEAAEKEGGDIRGKQSAAILIVTAQSSGKPWQDRLFDLRVEDHPQPVTELRRLVKLKRIYNKLNEGDDWLTKNEPTKAMLAYKEAMAMVPDKATNGEAAFWVGVTLASTEKVDEAIPYLIRAYQQDKRWAKLLPRLPHSKMLPDDPVLIEKLLQKMK